MANIVSQLVIQLIDKLSAPAKQTEKALAGVTKAAQGLEATGLAGTLAGVNRAAEQMARGGGRALIGWGDDFQKQLDRLRVSGRDFEAVRRSFEQLQQSMRAGGRIPAAHFIDGLNLWKRKTLDTLREIRTAHSTHEALMRRIVRGGAAVAGIGGGAYVANRVGRFAVTTGADTAREAVRQASGGVSAEESAILTARAMELSKKYPSLSTLDLRETGRRLIPNVGDTAKAIELLEEYARARVALKTITGGKEDKEEAEKLARFIDIIGRSRNVEDTRALLDGYIRARQLDDKALTADDYVNFSQSGGAAAKGFSVDFLSRVLPAFIMQQKGARTGTDFASAFQNFIVGRGTKDSLEEQTQFATEQANEGLRVNVKRDDKGAIVKGGHGDLVGEDLYMSNPYEWAKKYLVPRLVAKGALPEEYGRGDFSKELTTAQRGMVSKEMNRLFSNRRGSSIFTMMLSDMGQAEQIIERLNNRAQGTSKVEETQVKDPYVAFAGVMGSVSNLFSTLTEGPLSSLAPMLHSFAGGINKVNEALLKNPDVAKTAGIIATGAATAMAAGGAVGALKGVGGGLGGMVAGGAKGAVGTWPLYAPGLAALDTLTPEARARIEKGIDELSTKGGRAAANERAAKVLEDWYPWFRPRPAAPAADLSERDYTLGAGSGFKTKPSIRRAGGFVPEPAFQSTSFVNSMHSGSGPSARTPIRELAREAPRAGEAGTEVGARFRAALNAEIDKALLDAHTRIQNLIGILNFDARPSITPSGGASVGGQQHSSLGIRRRSVFADASLGPSYT